jgi:predicted amidohydrolase
MAGVSAGVFRAACVQVNAGPELEPNLDAAAVLVRRARDAGADFIALPENVGVIVQGRERIMERARTAEDHPGIPFFADLARETGAWLLAGTLSVRLDDGRAANRSHLFDGQGRLVAWYDKIHMFDVDLPGGESYRESASFRPGDRAVVARTPWGGLGLSVCYDVRFAGLYRALAHAGADMLTVPAAFTVPSGRAHWHLLLRARAVETGCFVFAPAQVGRHDGGRHTYGHALIVSPWGEVLADAGDEVGFVTADIDPDRVAEVRRMIPALTHDRAFTVERCGWNGD